MFVGIGGVLLFGVSMVQYTFFRTSAKLWYIAAIILLISVLILGESIRGTRGWFRVAGFSFQPVEFAKLGLILMLAYIVAHFGRRFEQPLFFIGTACVAGLPIVLIMLQPDLGSAIILGLIWLSLMLLVKVKRLHMALLVVAVVLASTLAWFFFLKDYQKDRLRNFINPERDRGGSGYNVTQSRIAVGSGKLLGRGLGFGSQSQLRFLPEAQTDFVFFSYSRRAWFCGCGSITCFIWYYFLAT
jgi:rod shape determining protein RodA